MVEQETFNLLVSGSNPLRPTTLNNMPNKELTEAEERALGEEVVKVLGLKPARGIGLSEPHYRTEWGTKTALGLYRTLKYNIFS